MSAGTVTTGISLSSTVTLNVPDAVLPNGSTTVHVTDVVPAENADPEAGPVSKNGVTGPLLSAAVTV